MIFGPRPTGRTPGAPGVHPRTRTHKTRNHLEPKSVGVPIYGKIPNSKIFGAAQTGPDFRAHFFRARAKNQNSAPNILLALSSSFPKGMTHPCQTKTIGGDRFGKKTNIWCQGPTLRASGSNSPTQKLLVISKDAPESLAWISQEGAKLWSF